MRGAVPKGIVSQIFAIGGGELQTRETFETDRLIAATTGRNRPWSLCVTAASGDEPSVCEGFGYVYGDSLRCRTDYLRLLKGEPGGDDYVRKIARSEIIYFADGDVRLLVETVKKFGVVDELRKAYERGVILCGVGAGAVCWGNAILGEDSLEGLGFIEANMGSSVTTTAQTMQKSVDKLGEPGILLDRLAVLHVKGSDYRVIAPDEAHRIRRFSPAGAPEEAKTVAVDQQFQPLASLKNVDVETVAAK